MDINSIAQHSKLIQKHLHPVELSQLEAQIRFSHRNLIPKVQINNFFIFELLYAFTRHPLWLYNPAFIELVLDKFQQDYSMPANQLHDFLIQAREQFQRSLKNPSGGEYYRKQENFIYYLLIEILAGQERQQIITGLGLGNSFLNALDQALTGKVSGEGLPKTLRNILTAIGKHKKQNPDFIAAALLFNRLAPYPPKWEKIFQKQASCPNILKMLHHICQAKTITQQKTPQLLKEFEIDQELLNFLENKAYIYLCADKNIYPSDAAFEATASMLNEIDETKDFLKIHPSWQKNLLQNLSPQNLDFFEELLKQRHPLDPEVLSCGLQAIQKTSPDKAQQYAQLYRCSGLSRYSQKVAEFF